MTKEFKVMCKDTTEKNLLPLLIRRSIGRIHRVTVGLLLAAMLIASTLPTPVRASELTYTDLYLPLVANRTCGGDTPADLFGVQMFGDTGRSSDYYPEFMQTGASWVRVPVAWRNVEPVNTDAANFEWADADRALAIAQDGCTRDGCINVIATHRWNPAWAADKPDGPVHADDLDDLAEYLAALVERYDGDGVDDAPGSPVVRYWELYNEPDAGPDRGGWGDDAARYAAMLEAARPAIRNASGEAKILLGGLGYDWFEDEDPPGPFRRNFLRNVVNAGGGDNFDIMNFHYYPDFADNWASYGPGLVGKTRAIREEMESLGLTQRRIMVTEAGHYADGGVQESSEELHMRYVVVLYTQAKARPNIENLLWFTLRDLDTIGQDTGLLETLSFAPYVRRRPAFRAYQVAGQQLQHTVYDRQLSDEETGDSTLEVHKLCDVVNDHALYVAWRNPVETDDFVPLYLPGSEALVRTVFGNKSSVTDAGDGSIDGRFKVSVSGRPVYVEVER